MTAPAMFGYLRVSLVAPTTMNMLEAKFAEVAALLGGSIDGRMFYEKDCPAQTLWSLLADSDRVAVRHITRLARQRGIVLAALLDTPVTHTRALWQLIDALDMAGGGYVLVPSPAHLDGTGVPNHVLKRRISALRGQVIWTGTEPADRHHNLIDEPDKTSILALADAVSRYHQVAAEITTSAALTDELPQLPAQTPPTRIQYSDNNQPREPAENGPPQPLAANEDTLRRIAHRLRQLPEESDKPGNCHKSRWEPRPAWQDCLDTLDSLTTQLRTTTTTSAPEKPTPQ